MPDEHTQDRGQRIGLAVLTNSGKLEKLRAEMESSEKLSPPTEAPIEASIAASIEPAASTQPPKKKIIEGLVIAALQTVYDPEIPVNIYELGLIYGIEVDDADHVKVKMTLTSPGCPVAGTLPPEVEQKIKAIPEVNGAEVELTWDPPWSKDRMSEAAMLQLGMF